jgi:hypothetical protein
MEAVTVALCDVGFLLEDNPWGGEQMSPFSLPNPVPPSGGLALGYPPGKRHDSNSKTHYQHDLRQQSPTSGLPSVSGNNDSTTLDRDVMRME